MTGKIDRLIELINQDIEEMQLESTPPELYEPIRYILGLGGKRLRPLLALLSYGLYKSNAEKIVGIASGIEVFHNFTLMHDDIMDEAPLRRGKPAVHEKWNTQIGVLSGDVMLVKAYERLEMVEEDKVFQVLQLFNTCATEVCEGQQLDMNFENMDTVSEDSYLEMIRLKTAVLLGFSMALGAVLAEAPEDHQQLLRKFGINIGLGFQLKDDLLDVYGDQAKFGKQVGGDIISNKKTYLLIKALETSTDSTHEELRSWLSKTDFVKRDKVAAVTKIYDQLSIKERTEQKMNHYFLSAYQSLEQLGLEESRVSELRSYANYLTHRER